MSTSTFRAHLMGRKSSLAFSVLLLLSLVLGPLMGVLVRGTTVHAATGAAVSLAVNTQPAGAVAATAFTTQPKFEAHKGDGSLETTFTDSVTVAIKSGTGTIGAVLSGTTSVAAVAGVATFTGLSIDKAGTGYVLVASSGSLTTVETAPFNVSIGAATMLAIGTAPAGATAGSTFNTQPTVEVHDNGGNVVTTSTASVTFAINTGTSGAVLSGTTTVAAVAGVATFTNLSLNLAGSYTIRATSGVLTAATSGAFTVSGTDAQLAFTTEPTGSVAGAAFTTQPVVTVRDASGNTVNTSTASVTVAITSGTGISGATLSGTTTVAAVNGVATFTNLSINKANGSTTYTLTATSSSLTPAVSAAFTPAIGAAAKLAVTTQPAGAIAGINFQTQPAVTIQDAQGNTVNSTANVTVAIANNPSAGTLSGTLTVAAVAGVATFTNLNINNAGTGYTLTATSGTLTSATTSAFNVNAGATKLAFSTQPSANNMAATNFGTMPRVVVQDADGNTVTNATNSITLSITSGTGTTGAVLSATGGLVQPAVAGVYTYADVQVDIAGSAYTLTATSPGLTSAVSTSFNVAGAKAKVAFTTSPAGAVAGTVFTTQPVVQIQDAAGRLIVAGANATDNVTVAITSGTGTSGAVMTTTLTVAAVGGVATFTNLQIDLAGSGYTLTASSAAAPAAATAPSASFTVSPNTATKVVFTTQPSAISMAGVAFGTQPVVKIEDAGGNVITTSTAPVTLTISAGTLSGTTTVNAVAGVATFSGLSVPAADTGLKITASSGSLATAVSNAFSIAGTATKVAFTTQPTAGTGGLTFGQPVVTVQDANGTSVINSTASVTVAIDTNPGPGTLSGTASMSAVAGVAAFTGLSINKAAAGYTLTAASTGLTGATSNAFNITLGAAAKLAFTTQPAGATTGVALLTMPVVTVQDAGGNTVTSDSSTVTLAVTTGTTVITVAAGGNTQAASSGVATFTATTFTGAGQSQVITATDGTLTAAVSDAFNVSSTTASRLAFVTQPAGAAAGATFTTQPVVEVQDANGNRITNNTATVVMAITSGSGTTGAGLSGTTQSGANVNKAASAGQAVYTDLSINAAGNGYTLTASSGALSAATSSSFNVAGVATKLAFTTQPAGAAPGVNFTSQPVVAVQDANGNTVTSAANSIVIAITSGTGTTGAALTATDGLTQSASSGVLAYAGMKIDLAGTGYTLTATASGLTSAVSTSFGVAIGTATQLAVTTSPGGSLVAGAAFGTQPVVTIQDANGLTVTSSTAPVTLAITTNPGSGTLSGTVTVNAVAGVANFSGLSINKVGAGYVLTATSGSLTSATTGAFTITHGTATQLAFTAQPSAANTAATNFGTMPQITVLDAQGNTVTTGAGATTSITIAITSGTGTSGAALSYTGSPGGVAAAGGVLTFAAVQINTPGSAYTLTAIATGLTPAVSTSLDVAGIAAKLAFTTQPGAGTGGVNLTAQPIVKVQDSAGRTVTTSGAAITLTLSGGTTGAVATIPGNGGGATSGVFTYTGVNVDKAGTGYILTAASGGLVSAVSSSFNITVGPATKLGFTTEPALATAGASFLTQPVIAVQDAGGNTVTSATDSIQLAITSGSGTSGSVLGGTATMSAASGVATFSGLSIDLAGTAYTLTATSGTLATAVSSTFNASGAATILVVTTPPASATAGAAFGTQPVVQVQDGSGNRVTASSASITLSITSSTGTSGAALSGTVTVAATNGQATFSGLSIDLAGTGYTLTAASTGLTSGVSGAFNVGAGAGQLAFTVQPSGSVAGAAFTTQPVVTVQDNAARTVTSFTGTVTLAITSGTGVSGATLSGTTTVTAVAGVATFTNLSIDKADASTTYTLTASSGGLITVASAAFTPNFGAASKLIFSQQPSAANTNGVNFGTMPQVTVQDAQGNTVNAATNNVTIAITSGTGATGATLSATATTVAANGVAGLAAFTAVQINLPASGYTLTATATGLTSAVSNSFSVAGAAAKLAITTQPAGAVGGAAFTTQPVVTVQDANGNTVSNSGVTVTLAIGTNPSAGALSGVAAVAASSGVTTFAGLSIDKSGTGYTLVATSPFLTSVTTSAFNVTAGAATNVVVTTSPAGAVAGAAFNTQPVVTVQDAGGNTVTTSSASIVLTLTSGTGTLSGTTTVSAVNGVATFSGLSIDLAQGPGTKRLTASSTGLAAGLSATFGVAGPATQLAFTTSPSSPTIGGATFATQPVVAVQDTFGNTVANSAASVTVAINTNPGTGTLSGTATVAAVNGVATFSGLSINKAGTGYDLVASSGTLTTAVSAGFNITAGAAAKLAFTTQATASNPAGSAFATQPVVTVQDSYGNTVTGDTSTVTLAITSGTGTAGATLGGTVTKVAAAGVASFAGQGLNITRAGTGYTLTATDGTLTSATSGSIAITGLTGSQVGFTTQPSGGLAGVAFTTQPVVAVQDGYGNTDTTSTASITLAIGTNPGSGTLSGTATVSAVAGVATFSGLSIDNNGTGYTLVASSSGLTSATSGAFNVAGAASQLAFTTQPAGATGGTAFTTQPVVTIRDSNGNTVTNSSASVTIAITSGTGTIGASLSGTATVAAVNGVATFSGLSINKSGTGYTLTASSTGLTSATSNALTVAVGPAAKLEFTTQPASATAGAAFGVQPAVTVEDAGGNAVTGSTATITLAITSGTGTTGAILSGTKTVAATSGVATFSGLSIDLAGTGYTLRAASSGLDPATSSIFNVAAGAAAKLAFTTQPASATADAAFGTQPVVTVQDANGNTATSFTSAVTLAVTSGTGGGGTLSGTVTINAVAGVSTFSGLMIDRAGNGYTLTATSAGLASATSNAFNVAASGAITQVDLVQGWNLVSLPRMPVDPAIAVVLQSITGGTVQQVQTWTGTGWLSWTAGPAPDDLSQMVDGVAYWVNMSATGTLDVSGANWTDMPTDPNVLPPTYDVTTGWNMVGFKSTTAKSVSAYLSGTDYRLTIYYWTGTEYAAVPQGGVLQPGRGYWVYFNAAGKVTP
ncbi:MAG: hypothetical protein HYY01_06990 [Chloroflexi bacterium]|nr:hypothetical protein [Chloroflexota bacterium]